MFSSAFSSAFAGRVAGEFIGPMMAQAALVNGAAWRSAGSSVVIGGRVLIGPAGKTYAFASPQSAARWIENTRGVGIRERALIDSLPVGVVEGWREKKREKLAVIAGRLVDAAAVQHDAAKRAALLAESDYCLAKWGL